MKLWDTSKKIEPITVKIVNALIITSLGKGNSSSSILEIFIKKQRANVNIKIPIQYKNQSIILIQED